MACDDAFGYHEVIHTAYIMNESWESFIVNHGAVELNPILKAEADKINMMIADFYQLVGREIDRRESEASNEQS